MNARTKTLRKKLHLLMLAAALIATGGLFVACGGGGGGGGGTAPTSTRSMGEITAKGSVFVNGVEFSTQGAELEIENEAPVVLGADDSALKEGMVVMVEGSSTAAGTGTATTIFVGDNVEGPISGVADGSSALIKTMVVLGQTIVVENGVTQFDNSNTNITSFAALNNVDSVGQVVEVSGFMRADGNIQATFIQEKAPGGIFEVKGVVSGFTAGGTTFSIKALTVSFATAVVDGVLANDVLVEVKGSVITGNTLTATSVEVEGGLGDDIAKVHVEGFVSGLSGDTFFVNGQRVNITPTTTFRGSTSTPPRDDLIDGVKVEVEGPLAGGALTASRITFKENVRFEANADVKGAGTLTLQGISGITIVADSLVTDPNDLAQIVSGNAVKVRARTTGTSGTLMATRIEKTNEQSSDRLIIQGPVDASSINATAGTFTILGVGVDTSAIVSNNFEIEDTIVTKAQFFAALKVGDIVKARADIGAGGALTWDQVEIEIED